MARHRSGGWRDGAGLLGFVALCLGVAGLGGWVTRTSVDTWYQQLAKPGFTPPDGVFPPVWTALFLLMAVAAWRVWRRRERPGRGRALAVFGGQLVLNLGWSVLFFGWRAPGPALAEIVLLLAAIIATMRLFAPVDRWAAYLLLPYLAWVTYAAALNGAIWWLNNGAGG
ncbi:MAG TPA: TspO/MBR family protein [Gammaproteobacteria bacterium]|nr:TspO/MBR family protein [Gammaproteobacteria bacterium]